MSNADTRFSGGLARSAHALTANYLAMTGNAVRISTTPKPCLKVWMGAAHAGSHKAGANAAPIYVGSASYQPIPLAVDDTRGFFLFVDDASLLYFKGTSRIGYYRRMRQAMRGLAQDPTSNVIVWPGRLARGLEHLAALSENRGRQAEFRSAFRQAKGRGLDDYNAALYAAAKARDLLDFAVAGTTIRKINQFIPFTSAGARGVFRFVEGMKRDPKGVAARWATYVLLPTLAAYGISAARGKDDEEEYRAQPAYLRDLFWNIKLGPNLWLRIPKPFELGVFASGVERAIDQARGKPHAFDGYGGSLAKSLLPVDESALAGPFRTLTEAVTNYDWFRGRYIIPPYENDLELSRRKGADHASRVGQVLQRAIGVDGRKIDQVFLDQFGGYGRLITGLSDIGRADKHTLGDTLTHATGLLVPSPAYAAGDVQWVLQRARETGQSDTAPVKRLMTLVKDYQDSPTAADKDTAARVLREYAAALRTKLEEADDAGKALRVRHSSRAVPSRSHL